MTAVEAEGLATYAALTDIRPHNAGLLRTVTAVDAYTGTTASEDVNAFPVLDGIGVLQSRLGFTFRGRVKNGEPCGQGLLRWADGRTVAGFFTHGTVDGVGTLQWPSGDVYTGALRHSVRHGSGCFVSDNGASRYEGAWKDGMRHGSGVQHYANGSVYEGQWVHNRRQGCGTLRYGSGDVYEGSWEADVPSGHGVMGWVDATGAFYNEIYTGEWQAGKPAGSGQSTYVSLPKCMTTPTTTMLSTAPPPPLVVVLPVPSKFMAPAEARLNVYVGDYADGLREGAGTFYYADGSCYFGQWKAGAKSGAGSFTSAVGETREETHPAQGGNRSVAAGHEVSAEAASNALAAVPTVSPQGLGSLLESEEDLRLTLHNLLHRYNTTLKLLFQHCCQLREDVALPSTHADWWQQRLPGRVTLVQCLALLHRARLIGTHFTIGDALRTAAEVVRIETTTLKASGSLTPPCLPPLAASSTMDEISRADGTLNYRQFCEWLIRVAAQVERGPDMTTVSTKLRALLEGSLGTATSAPATAASSALSIAAVFLPRSVEKAAEVQRHLPALMRLYKELESVGDEAGRRVSVRTFLTAVRGVLLRHSVTPSEVVQALAWVKDASTLATGAGEDAQRHDAPALSLAQELRRSAMARNRVVQQPDEDTEAAQSFVEFVETVMSMAHRVFCVDGTTLDVLLDEVRANLFKE